MPRGKQSHDREQREREPQGPHRFEIGVDLRPDDARAGCYSLEAANRLLKYDREGNAGILPASSSGHSGCTTAGQDARMTGQTGSLSYASPGISTVC